MGALSSCSLPIAQLGHRRQQLPGKVAALQVAGGHREHIVINERARVLQPRDLFVAERLRIKKESAPNGPADVFAHVRLLPRPAFTQ